MNEIESVIRLARQAQVDRIYKSFANADEVTRDEDGITKARVPGETKVINGKTFVYTEYAPGKFDWQLAKNSKKKPLDKNKQNAETVKQNVANFVKKNSANLYEYLVHGADNVDAEDAKKFASLERMGWSAGKSFDSADKTAAERYVRKMKQRGYEVHEVEGISDYAYLLKKADDTVDIMQDVNPFDSLFKANQEDDDEGEDTGYDEDVNEEEDEDGDDESEKAFESDIEKSDIMNAFGYGSDVKVTKTGKEIAEQVDTVILPALNAKLIEKKSDADDLLAECGNAPTKEVPVWWTGDVKIPVEYKMYDWEETCVPSNDDGGIASSLSAPDAEEKRAKYNRPENADQANARRQYNDCVRCVCEILVDIKACEILKSLKPGKEYELSTRQVVALQF